MTLVVMLLILTVPYLLLILFGRLKPDLKIPASTGARLGITLLFLFTASGHFVQTAAMAEMLPPFVPYRVDIIYVTGVIELLGAIGLCIPRLRQLVGICLILMLIGVLPSNIYSAINRVPFGGHGAGPLYLLVRVPFQFFLIGWIYWFVVKRIEGERAVQT